MASTPHRGAAAGWGLGHFLLFGSVAATGAGLHVAAYYLEGAAHLGPTESVLTVAIPVTIYVLTLYAIYWTFLHQHDTFHLLLLVGTAAVIGLAVICAELGASTPYCLVIVMLAPAITVIGFESVGHRHLTKALLKN